ncbi:unnamed protein product, partial [Iphiclides podalirius]
MHEREHHQSGWSRAHPAPASLAPCLRTLASQRSMDPVSSWPPLSIEIVRGERGSEVGVERGRRLAGCLCQSRSARRRLRMSECFLIRRRSVPLQAMVLSACVRAAARNYCAAYQESGDLIKSPSPPPSHAIVVEVVPHEAGGAAAKAPRGGTWPGDTFRGTRPAD